MPKGIPDEKNPLTRLERQRIETVVDLLRKDADMETILETVFFVIRKSRERLQEIEWYHQYSNGKASEQQINEARRIYYTKFVRSIERGLER